jgi:predicted DNA-binding transcriptional regulator AlpA
MSVRRNQAKALPLSPEPIAGGRVVKTSNGVASISPEMVLVPATKLRSMIGISAVTLWRWRQNEAVGFPRAIMINGRNYFPWADVQGWLARQQQAA